MANLGIKVENVLKKFYDIQQDNEIKGLYAVRMLGDSSGEILWYFFNSNNATYHNPKKSSTSNVVIRDINQNNSAYLDRLKAAFKKANEQDKKIFWLVLVYGDGIGLSPDGYEWLASIEPKVSFDTITASLTMRTFPIDKSLEGFWKPCCKRVEQDKYFNSTFISCKDDNGEFTNKYMEQYFCIYDTRPYREILYDVVGTGYRDNKDYIIDFTTNIKKSIPRNRIIFGAPGTGKSFQLNRDKDSLLENGGEFERVTFHANYSYANFVGTYKPVMVKPGSDVVLEEEKQRVIAILQDKNKTAQEKYDLLYDDFKDEGLTRLPILLGIYTDDNFKTRKIDGTNVANDNSVERNHGRAIKQYLNLSDNVNNKKEISYEYVPGPFMRVLAKALKSAMSENPKPYVLIIEEINRANTAAVFGDVFQLLDRDEDGVSEYSISTSQDMRTYLAKELGVDESAVETIKIPDNMFIWATMNSADQGVFPMDTAFKRRWDFEYIGIDEEEKEVVSYVIPIGNTDNRKYIYWNDLRKAINNKLSSEECKVNEDKLLGPFFISKSALETALDNEEKFVKFFESKVLMYLFEDAMKMSPKKIFEGHAKNGGRMIFSEICKAFREDGVEIFGFDTSMYVPKP